MSMYISTTHKFDIPKHNGHCYSGDNEKYHKPVSLIRRSKFHKVLTLPTAEHNN